LSKGDIDGRAYRKYTDGTIKAQTSSGWLEFPSYDALSKYHHKRKLIDRSPRLQWLKKLFNPKTNNPDRK